MLLAIDTSTSQGSVALAAADGAAVAVRERTIDDGWQHGRLLICAVDALLREAGRTLAAVDAFACGIGPGSYTGTRIGVIAAKTLAWCQNRPLYGVSSLAALALCRHAADGAAAVVALQDARKDEIYAGAYAFTADGMPEALRPDAALNPRDAAALIAPGAVVTGNGVWDKYPDAFAAARAAGAEFRAAPAAPTLAAAVARIALSGRIAAGDPKTLEPVYMRREEAPCTFEKYAREHPQENR